MRNICCGFSSVWKCGTSSGTHYWWSLVTFSFSIFSLPQFLHLVDDYFTKTHIHTEVKKVWQKIKKGKNIKGIWGLSSKYKKGRDKRGGMLHKLLITCITLNKFCYFGEGTESQVQWREGKWGRDVGGKIYQKGQHDVGWLVQIRENMDVGRSECVCVLQSSTERNFRSSELKLLWFSLSSAHSQGWTCTSCYFLFQEGVGWVRGEVAGKGVNATAHLYIFLSWSYLGTKEFSTLCISCINGFF